MPEIVSVYDVSLQRRMWRKRRILYLHPEPGDRYRIFLLGEEEALVAFLIDEELEVTDPRALDPAFWREGAAGPCETYVGISRPLNKRGHKPKRRGERNRNRQKWGRLPAWIRHVCLGECPQTGQACQPVDLGNGVIKCVCR